MFKLSDIFKSKVGSTAEVEIFTPQRKAKPEKLIEVASAWAGLEEIIEDVLNRFEIGRDNCIEFGVEFGYSAVVFSNYFKQVTGIDTFKGDRDTINKSDHYDETSKKLASYANIRLVKSDYKNWIAQDTALYDFAHVDIVHNYRDTYRCGLWAAIHSNCTVFHDTESFPEVMRAVKAIAKATGKRFYNYPHNNGLGIIVNPVSKEQY